MLSRISGLGVALALSATFGCRAYRAGGPAEADGRGTADTSVDSLLQLRVFEETTRARTDFAHKETSDTALGTDPYVLRPLAGTDGTAPEAGHFVGLLRGRSALVELDASLHELTRISAPASPTGLAVAANGDVYVVGELSDRVARYRGVHGVLEPAGEIDLPGVCAMRDVAIGPEGLLYVVEEHDGRLVTIEPPVGGAVAEPAKRVDAYACHEPIHVARTAHELLIDCLLDHAIVIKPIDAHGFPAEGETRITHDGPMWGLDAIDDGNGLVLAVGGVEDHPLDRTEGSFGFVDSFVTLYRFANGGVSKLREVNTSELGVVTPKALRLSRAAGGSLELAVAGYASDHLLLLDWNDGASAGGGALAAPAVKTWALAPGSAMIARLGDGSFVIANPLLDSWVHAASGSLAIVHVDDAASHNRSVDSRVGEALFFTTLMAPWNKSKGRLSRFTCETCHWEGYDDGRTHHTGRADVHATTKPLLGLFNNRPHFSRALDPDLTTMVNNEFRVANAKSDHDPWFSLTTADFPWLKELGVGDAVLSPERLRRSLMAFFMDFTHRPNPSVGDRAHWNDSERRGALVFQSKCESCHEARLIADAPATRQPFDAWEGQVMSREDPIVWAHSDYEKTGVTPYVNERGARVVSLRRLYKKYPYFTNGSAKTVRNVLDRVAFSSQGFWHDGAPRNAAGLTDEEKAALASFLDLL